jgi:hypothetical protein
MALISQSDLEAKLGRNLTAAEASAFTIVNASMQAEIERMIGSSLEEASETTRYYDGGVQHLAIDPCTNVTSVKSVDDDQVVIETYDTSDYTIEPVNNTLKTQVRNRGRFYTGINNIAVTAKFSIYADTAMVNIIKNIMLEALTSEVDNSDNVKRESIEGYSIEYASTETKNALTGIGYLFPRIF